MKNVSFMFTTTVFLGVSKKDYRLIPIVRRNNKFWRRAGLWRWGGSPSEQAQTPVKHLC